MSIDSTGQKEANAAGEDDNISSISCLVVEYIVAIDVTWVRFPADAWIIVVVLAILLAVTLTACCLAGSAHVVASCCPELHACRRAFIGYS